MNTPQENAPQPKPIRALPRDLAAKIAAGEVVERPGSAVKELVENAIDAGATRIRVELEEAGKKRLSVIDNGTGILEDQVLLALERHATSKISTLDDLWNLSTMGFRGEALPSIAAISRFTLETKTAQGKGRKIYLEGGRLLQDTPLSAQNNFSNSGTKMTVEDLFFNVPARLKFQRAKNSESSFIRDILERIAISHPLVHFEMTVDGKRTLDFRPQKDETYRIAEVLRTDVTHLEYFESQFESVRISGWLDQNARASNSQSVYFSVNQRMVRDKLLHQAVISALRSRMMEGEYPRLYLQIQVSPQEVDVNVHPAKSEVRFQKSRDVFQLIHGALEKLAREPKQNSYLVSMGNEQPSWNLTATTNSDPLASTASQEALFKRDTVSTVYSTKTQEERSNTTETWPTQTPRESSESSAFARESFSAATQSTPAYASSTKYQLKPGFTKLHYIGQLKNTYLLFQDEDGLVLIDQHAAHERINYEKIKTDFMSAGLKPQPLLVGATVKLTPEETALALDFKDQFLKLGFELESFGDTCVVLRTTPEFLESARAIELFKATLEEFKSADSSDLADLLVSQPTRLSAKLERLLSTQACHGSVRAGQALSSEEARALAFEMEETASSLNCPHGRPASIKLKFEQIEGLFKRRV